MHAIDRSAWSNRYLQHPPAERAGLALGALLLNSLLPSLTLHGLTLCSMTLLVLWAQISWRSWLGFLALPAGFLLSSAPFLALSLYWDQGVHWQWHVDGIEQAGRLALRALASVSCLGLLVLTTPLPQLLQVLRTLKVPDLMIELLGLTYQLIWVLIEQAQQGYHAQAARLGHYGWRTGLHSVARLSAGLLQRSLQRAQRLEYGLASRGYSGGELCLLSPPLRYCKLRLMGIAVWLGLLAVSGIYG